MAVPVPAADLTAGRHYPKSEAQLRAWFGTDAACRDFLEFLRWPAGFECPTCGPGIDSCRIRSGAWQCYKCQTPRSVLAGTIFERTRTPLTVWFSVAWHMTASKSGVSAATLQRLLGFGSYQTVWAMLHRYRLAMVRPGRDRLSGDVQVDESYLGGLKPGKRGRGAMGRVPVAIAVEALSPKGFGRARMQVLPTVSGAELRAFLVAHVEPGSVVVTDGLSAYKGATTQGYTHKPTVIGPGGAAVADPTPGTHRVSSLTKRWIAGTHQGGVSTDHLQAYLNEFAFRWDRRRSRSRGLVFRRLLEQAVDAPPATYANLIANKSPLTQAQIQTRITPPPRNKRVGPATLEIVVGDWPWRQADA